MPRLSPLSILLCALACSTAMAQSHAKRALDAVRTQLDAHGFVANDLADVVVLSHYTSNGITHTAIRQRWQGVEVWNGDIVIHQRDGGEVLQVHIGAFRHVEKRLRKPTATITAGQALAAVLPRTAPGILLPEPVDSEDDGRRVTFDGTLFSNTPVVVQQYYLPVEDSLRLVWNVNHYLPDGSHWWNVRVDAATGEELERNDWVVNCGPGHAHPPEQIRAAPVEEGSTMLMAPNEYRVLPWPIESPSHGARAIRTAPWLDGGIASPYGWHDTNGIAGADQTDTRGNNVRAQEDRNADNAGGNRPSGGANLEFDFALNLANAPNTYQDAAITNLFYWNNIMHDVWYQYGFDEPSGNFQQNNYGRGGIGNDWVNADAQDGSGTDNANFATPPDGTSPRMQMFEWTYTTPRRDSDLDNGVIAHEYGHGISNRLVGGSPANTNCLTNAEQMGEGWSDFIALVMTIKPGDTGPMPRGIGTYVVGQPPTGGGIRPAPYSTDFNVNSYTYGATNNTAAIAQPHGIGFVWCTILWEMTWELIGLHGLDPDIYNGTGGNNIAMRLVIEGMKLTPCNPGFVQARNAILQADQALYGGANQNALWAAFARRGLGSSASQGSANSRTDQTEAFDTPMTTNVGIAQVISPTGQFPDCGGAPINVTAVVRNFGSQAQSNIPVRYRLNADAWVNATVSGTLAPGASTTFTFPVQLPMPGVGTHTITVATNLTGDMYTGDNTSSSSITITTPVILTPSFVEGLPVPGPTPPGWTIQNPDNGITWASGTIDIGSTCGAQRVWFKDNYNDAAVGEEDALVTPLVDLSYMTDIILEFDHAYARYNATYSDAFRVDISADCGASWTQIFHQAGATLATAANTTAFYVPTNCNQWRHNGVNITAYAGQTVMFRFITINGFGNTFLMDNVAVNGISTLPVELVRLTATPGNEGIDVGWTTASETNSERYDVERSTDLSTWSTIGTVRAAGNSLVTTHYHLLDPRPRAGTNYYRLHMVDLDGTTERSEVVSAEWWQGTPSLHPNPNHGSFTMATLDPIEVWDATGRLVPFTLSAADDGRVQVDLLEPVPGVYMVRTAQGRNKIVVTAQ